MVLALVVVAVCCAACAPSSPEPPQPDRTAPGIPGTPAMSDVRYGPDPRHRLDVYRSTGTARGVIVTVHGGGFSAGDRRDLAEYFGPILDQRSRGFAVVNVAYRTGVAGAFPASVDDVAAAVRWVHDHGPDAGLNTSTVLVAGHSAGATIAGLVAARDGSDVDGWVGFAGVYDFSDRDRRVVDLAANWSLGPVPDPRASLVHAIDAFDPPGFVTHAVDDPIVPHGQLERLVRAATTRGPRDRLTVDSIMHRQGCNPHVPQCAMNRVGFDRWVDTAATTDPAAEPTPEPEPGPESL
jgi:acetyl esterase/lipase